MRHGEVNEFLVVGIAASDRGFGCDGNKLRILVELSHHVSRTQLIESQARDDLFVAQHALQFFAHGLGGQPVQFARGQRLLQRLGGGVVEDEGIEEDVGVDDDCAHVVRSRINGVRAQFRSPLLLPEALLS